MEDTITIPEKPWTDADVAFLIHNADFLPQEIKEELGLTPVEPDEDFKADFDAAKEIISPAVETGEIEPSGVVEMSVLTEEEIAEGVAAFNALPPEAQEAARAEAAAAFPTDVDGGVVNNEATDKA